MKNKIWYILPILLAAVLCWAFTGYSSQDEEEDILNAFLQAHEGEEILISLEVSFFDEIGKVLIAKLLDVEEAGIVVMLLGDIHSERDGRCDHGDTIELWAEKKLSVFLTYSNIVSIQLFKDAKETVWKHLRWKQMKKEQERQKKER